MEYSKSFADRALQRIQTPAALPSNYIKAEPVNQSVSLAQPIQLPITNPWDYANKRPVPQPPSRSTVGTVFLISGVCLLLIGLGLYLSGASKGDDTLGNALDNVFQTIAGQICMIIGGVFTIVGAIMKLTEPRGGRRY
jgi:hypothetical protein